LLSFDLRPQHGFSLQAWALLKGARQHHPQLETEDYVGDVLKFRGYRDLLLKSCSAYPLGRDRTTACGPLKRLSVIDELTETCF
jgi:hypothetical protein